MRAALYLATLLTVLMAGPMRSDGPREVARIPERVNTVGLRNPGPGCWAKFHLHAGPIGTQPTGYEMYGLSWVPAGEDVTISVEWVRVVGDLDGDGRVNPNRQARGADGQPLATDRTWFEGCLSGACVPHAHDPRCYAADLDGDGDVDAVDAGLLQLGEPRWP